MLTRETLRRLLRQPAGAHADIPQIFLLPEGEGPFPAVLYCHAHGGNYPLGKSELTEGSGWTDGTPYAPDLLAAGFAVLCLDMACFEDRQNEGPESAASKAALWRGQTLFGAMLRDLQSGLDQLCADPRIDSARIYTLGGSMGGAHALWLAALDERVAGAAHLFFFSDIGPLIDADMHDPHGHYLTVPGLLEHGDVGDVAALIAPRPQFVGTGGEDRFTPDFARLPATERLTQAYADGALQVKHIPDTGHKETPDMRRAVMDFLTRAARKETT